MGQVAIQEQQAGQLMPISDSGALMNVIASAARDPNVDVEKMERLFAMHERMTAKQAEVEFNDAMNRAQASMRRIATDKTNSQTHSEYASYGALDRVLRPIYTEEGFSLSFDTEDAPEGVVGMLCYVSHKAGHTRNYRAHVPSDGKGAKGNDVMTKTHAFGSGTQYGMRYLLKMIFNVAIGEDDDGNGAADPLNGKDATWIQVAAGVDDPAVYKAEKARMLADYGTVAAIPAKVREAFNRANERSMPRD